MQSIVAQLRERIGTTRADRGCFATGTLIDELLPHGCFRRGTLVELFGPGAALAVVLARESLRAGGMLAVIDPARRFYPPALVNMGFDLNRLVIVQPEEPDWIVIQALSCSAMDAVLYWPDRSNDKMFRRWQLAAERGGSTGLLLRPSASRGDPSWADVQLEITPLALSRWRLKVAERSLDFSINNQGRIHDCVRVVSELDDPASAARATGA